MIHGRRMYLFTTLYITLPFLEGNDRLRTSLVMTVMISKVTVVTIVVTVLAIVVSDENCCDSADKLW